ncbi:MAG: GerW family sporulation protein [Oscillospiraceae bacterium]|jgi:sporulation protein YtfJ|nr:GerW family sporulation protein [Oscillospiraceae bacterium]
MAEHPIENLMSSSMQKIREMVDVNTIVGDPILVAENVSIIPISKVTYGFGAGGSDFLNKKNNEKNLFGGGSGAGISISPIAVLVVKNDNVKLIQVEPFHSSLDKIIDMAPDFLEKVKSIFSKSSQKINLKNKKES